MSEPMVSTGHYRPSTCTSCGRDDITEAQLVGAFTGAREYWCADKHDAPCGLPCFGAGVHGKVYRSGRFHRDAEHCPICAAPTDTAPAASPTTPPRP